MANAQKLIKISRVILLLGALYGLIAICYYWTSQTKNTAIEVVPENANFVLKIDGKSLAQRELTGVFTQNDDETIGLIQEILKRRKRKIKDYVGPKRKGLDIDYLSNSYFFSTPENIQGIAFSLLNEEKFKENISTHIDSNSVALTKGNIGMILWSNENLSKEKIQSIGQKIIASNSHFDDKAFESNEDILLQAISQQSNSNDWLSQSSFSISHKENKLHFEGKVPAKRSFSKEISPHDFHIHTNEVSPEINHTIADVLSPLGLELPDISLISANYGGMEIQVKGQQAWFIPQADLWIQFDENFDLFAQLSELDSLNDIQIISDKQIDFRGQKYFYEQVSSNSIYLGIRPLKYSNRKPKIKSKKYFVVQGNPKLLTDIKATPLVMALLAGVKEFVSFRQLFDKMEYISIEIDPNSEQNLKGTFEFQGDKDAYVETVKFLMQSGLIR